MAASTMVIGDRRYRIDANVDELKEKILAAAATGPNWVTIQTVGGRITDVLVTPTTEARLEHPWTDDVEDVGDHLDSLAAPRGISGFVDFDDYLL